MTDLTDIVTDHITPLASPDRRQAPEVRAGHFAWIDTRGLTSELTAAVIEAAIHQRVDGIVAADHRTLADLPPTIRRILAVDDSQYPDLAELPQNSVDLILRPSGTPVQHSAGVASAVEQGVHVTVSDAPTLHDACRVVRQVPWTVLTFTDPTKIPLEIVIAAAENSGGRTVTVVDDIQDAEIVKLVLEHGSDGLLLTPTSIEDIATLVGVVEHRPQHLDLVEFTVTSVEHIGMGERACIDTCSLLELDEGCLIGSFATGMFLSCSETHPLPYMPTRPFRWNAGAVHSYVLGPENRTRYVSELRAGQPILAVRTDGSVREVRIGRVKIERRPLISINATTPGGASINVIAQDDWHVRLLGPGATVNNVTELRAGDKLLGYVPTASRHVGLPITEFCDER